MIPETIAVGIPADMLRRRPDIRKAERELAAQTARIGVAMAELYPKLRLSGSIGLEALEAGELLNSSSLSGATAPAFHGIFSIPVRFGTTSKYRRRFRSRR